MNIVSLSIRASNLPDVATLLKTGSPSCPFAVVTLLTDDREPTVLGKTEVIENSLDPEWNTTFLINYEKRSKATYILVKIFHETHSLQDSFKELGSGVFELGTIVTSDNRTATKTLKRNCGAIEVQVEPFQGQAWLRLKMKGLSFKNTRGFMKKLTPFYQFTRVDAQDSGRENKVDAVHKSDKTLTRSLRPDWVEETIDIDTLCDSDLNLPLRLSIYHHRSNGNHELVGEMETCVNDIISAKKSGSALEIKKNHVVIGSIAIEEASMAGIEEGKTYLQDVRIFSERKHFDGIEVALTDDSSFGSMQSPQSPICV